MSKKKQEPYWMYWADTDYESMCDSNAPIHKPEQEKGMDCDLYGKSNDD